MRSCPGTWLWSPDSDAGAADTPHWSLYTSVTGRVCEREGRECEERESDEREGKDVTVCIYMYMYLHLKLSPTLYIRINILQPSTAKALPKKLSCISL